MKANQHFLDVEPTIVAREGENGVPRFEMLAYNADSALRVRGFDAPVVIDLMTAKFERTVTKINRNHDQSREVGHATEQRIDATGIYFAGLLSVPGQDTTEIVEAAKSGFPWDASIEASFPKARYVPKNQTVVVNGHSFSGVYVARNAVLTGVAILNRGADRRTQIAIAATELTRKNTMTKELKEFIEAQGFDPDVVADNDSQLEFMQAAFEAQDVDPDPPKKKTKIIAGDGAGEMDGSKSWESMVAKQREKAVAEAERINDIQRICAEFKDPEIILEDDSSVSLAAHAIKTGMSAKETRLEAKLFDLENKSSGYTAPTPALHNASKNDDNSEVIEAAMVLATGKVSEQDIKKNNWYDEKVMNEATRSRFRGFRVSRLAYQTMKAAGIYHPPGQLDDTYIRKSVQAHQKLMASGFTTISLPGIMSNVANKTMMAAYNRAPSLIPFFFGMASATDFKPVYSYQLEGSGMLEKLPHDGEIKHGKLAESQYTKSLETHAKMLAFTRQDFINDDMGALSRITSILGEMSFKAREYAAVQTIANSTMFTAPNGNLIAANPLGIDGLTASGTAFDGQTDQDGFPISIDGDRILAPSSQKVIVNQLQNQTEIRVNGGTGKNFTNNPHAGTFTAFTSAWLDNDKATQVGGVTDPNRSGTWYRIADPSAVAAFEVLYLNGQSSPTIQSAETDFNTLGMQWRCYFDFGFGQNDPKYGQKNLPV